MSKENEFLPEEQEWSDSQILKEELLDLEDVDALLEQVMREAEELGMQSQAAEAENTQEDELLQNMDSFMEQTSGGEIPDMDVLAALGVSEQDILTDSGARGTDMLMSFEGDEAESEPYAAALFADAGAESGKTGKKTKAKKAKVKKEKVKKEKNVKEKKQGKSFKDRFMEFAFDSDEDDEATDNDGFSMNSDKYEDSEGNKSGNKKASKEKKAKEKKAKKGKKGAKGNATSADDNEAIEAQLAEEDKKEKKPKKQKKEKKPKKIKEKKNEEPEKPGISPKVSFAVILACLSFAVVILVCAYVVPMQISLQKARTAFYMQDYKAAVERLYGRKLGKSDQILYKKAVLLNTVTTRLEQYEVYLRMNKPKDALNQLFEGYSFCQKERVAAQQYGVSEEMNILQERMVTILAKGYGLSEEDIIQITDMKRLEYSIALDNILAGLSYDEVSVDDIIAGTLSKEPETMLPDETEADEVVLEDMLPEEAEMLKEMEEVKNQQEEEPRGDKPLFEGTVEGGEIIFTPN